MTYFNSFTLCPNHNTGIGAFELHNSRHFLSSLKVSICLNCLMSQSKAMVMSGLCFHFMGLVPKISVDLYEHNHVLCFNMNELKGFHGGRLCQILFRRNSLKLSPCNFDDDN